MSQRGGEITIGDLVLYVGLAYVVYSFLSSAQARGVTEIPTNEPVNLQPVPINPVEVTPADIPANWGTIDTTQPLPDITAAINAL